MSPEHPAVARALAYPFGPPDHAYVFENGEARAYDPGADAVLLQGRRPILAVGSNAAPRRLAEKFGANAVAAVTSAVVTDHVVAHSAKFAGYASIPATLHPWPGARAHLHATWLTAEQLAIMDETETLGVAYDRVTIASVELLDAPNVAASIVVETYVSRAGAFGMDGRPAVSAAARVDGAADLPVLDQESVQRRAMTALGIAGDLHDFIAANTADDALREARSTQLSALVGLPFASKPA